MRWVVRELVGSQLHFSRDLYQSTILYTLSLKDDFTDQSIERPLHAACRKSAHDLPNIHRSYLLAYSLRPQQVVCLLLRNGKALSEQKIVHVFQLSIITWSQPLNCYTCLNGSWIQISWFHAACLGMSQALPHNKWSWSVIGVTTQMPIYPAHFMITAVTRSWSLYTYRIKS